MADGSDLADDGIAHDAAGDAARVRRWRAARRGALAGAGLVALALGVVWGWRERIAADLIDRELAVLRLPARYRIESIGPSREVITAVAVGDPAHPDLTIDRIEIALRYGLTGPAIDGITLVRPRFHGRQAGARISFGALDQVIYSPSSGPVRLPDWALTLVDARGRIDTAYGAVGLSADGSGRLANGFSGTLGGLAPQVQLGKGCGLARASLFARITTHDGRPHLDGPLRLAGGACDTARLAQARVDLAVGADSTMSDWTIDGHLDAGPLSDGAGLGLERLAGEIGLHWQAGHDDLGGRVTLDAGNLVAPQARLGRLRLDGVVHARQGLSAFDFRGDLDGRSLARGPALAAALKATRARAEGTPLAPLFDRLDAALAREEPDSRLTGSLGAYRDASGWRLAVPRLALRGGHSGQTVANLDRLSASGGAGHVPRFSGNFTTSGPDLPAITGSMANADDRRGAHLRLAMAAYGAGAAQASVPAMAVTQAGDGSLGFAGTVAISGPIGAGRVDNLVLPIDGTLSDKGAVALWRHCAAPRFDRLRDGTLDLAQGTLKFCPTNGAVLHVGAGGITLSAALPGLALDGRAGERAFVLRADGGRLAWPGASTLQGVDLALGSGEGANRLHLGTVAMAPSGVDGAPGGTFAGGDATLAALPATVSGAGGLWRIEHGHLVLSGTSLTLADRTAPARFAPVAVRDATVTADAGTVHAQGRLVAPGSGAELAQVALRHDLASGRGHADVTVAGLTFRDATAKAQGPVLQPADLTDLAKGVVANANGTIKGTAQFDWNADAPDGALRGSGRFGSDDFDFAAALGPVEGLSGTIEFTDLVHLVTAPHQVLKIASVNPGIEVDNGVIDIDTHPGQVIRLNSAQWPFEGGTLRLEPTELHMAVAEPRTFTLVINGLEAGRFIQHMNMSNISATGVFDGRLPLVFDANGGRITGGQLVSRVPGGNVSYVGALSYRDLSPMANFAFRMLRSVDYSSMTIGLEGDLGGEVVTRVSFSGIRQGKGAERNLITRQLARVPMRFDVNVRAQFYQLISSLRSLYDPTMVRDPRELGLVDAQGRPLHHQHGQVSVGAPGAAAPHAIQPQASGTMP
jgi:hypothetical protein